jgi:hypothetical protein
MIDRLPLPPKIPPRPENNPWSDAMYEISEALQYPVDSRGRVYDVRFLIPVLSFHLARAGFDKIPDRTIIKKRRLPPAPGVYEDAVEWVGINTPDRVEDELAGVTIDDVDLLSPAARAELIRRLGGESPQDTDERDLDEQNSWRVQTSIHFDD